MKTEKITEQIEASNNLAQITNEFSKMIDAINNDESDDYEKLTELSMEFLEKIKAIRYVLLGFDKDVELINDEIARLEAKKIIIERKKQRLINWSIVNMQILKLEDMSTPTMKFKIKKNAFSVSKFDVTKFDGKYIKTSRPIPVDSVNKELMLKDFKELVDNKDKLVDDTTIPGVTFKRNLNINYK